MTNLDNVKNRLIDRILVTNTLDFLVAVENLFSSAQKEDIYNLSSGMVNEGENPRQCLSVSALPAVF